MVRDLLLEKRGYGGMEEDLEDQRRIASQIEKNCVQLQKLNCKREFIERSIGNSGLCEAINKQLVRGPRQLLVSWASR